MEEANNINMHGSFPDEIKKFNWGAFLFPVIWGLGNRVHIAFMFPFVCFLINATLLICFDFQFRFPVFSSIATIFSIWLGINGNKFAWEKGKWTDIDQFNNIQRKWAMWLATLAVSVFLIALYVNVLNNSQLY